MQQHSNADLDAMTHLQEVGEMCASSDAKTDECLDHILDTAITVMNAEKGNIQLIDESGGFLRLTAHRGFQESFVRFFDKVNREDAAACGAAMRTNGRVIIEDVMKWPVCGAGFIERTRE